MRLGRNICVLTASEAVTPPEGTSLETVSAGGSPTAPVRTDEQTGSRR